MFRRHGGEVTLHAGSFALSLDDGEFGDRSTGLMPSGGAFVALTEYAVGPGLDAGGGLFAPRGIPVPLDPTSFSGRRLAHARPGHLGSQHFFTVSWRPFCLYVVLAAPAGARTVAAGRRGSIAQVNALLRSIEITPRPRG
jgi:hypothetical protein